MATLPKVSSPTEEIIPGDRVFACAICGISHYESHMQERDGKLVGPECFDRPSHSEMKRGMT